MCVCVCVCVCVFLQALRVSDKLSVCPEQHEEESQTREEREKANRGADEILLKENEPTGRPTHRQDPARYVTVREHTQPVRQFKHTSGI